MSNYVIKVFEKQENGDLIPFALNEEGTRFDLEGAGVMLFGLTEQECGDTVRLETQCALHDVTGHMIAQALKNNDVVMDALKQDMLRTMLGKLMSKSGTDEEKGDEDAAE